MVKVIIYDWIEHPDDIFVFEGEREEAEIHLRSRYMKLTKNVALGDWAVLLLTVKNRFGLHLECWEKYV